MTHTQIHACTYLMKRQISEGYEDSLRPHTPIYICVELEIIEQFRKKKSNSECRIAVGPRGLTRPAISYSSEAITSNQGNPSNHNHVFYPYSTNYGFATPFAAWGFVQQVLNYLGTDCARLSSVFYLKFCRSRQILCLALRHSPSATLLNNLVSDFYIPF